MTEPTTKPIRVVSFTLAGPGTAPIIGDALRSVATLADGAIVIWTGPESEWRALDAMSACEAFVGPPPWGPDKDGRIEFRAWPWSGSYGEARNVALVMAGEPFYTGALADWACMVDTDERVICPDPEAFRSWLASIPGSIAVVLVHHNDGSHTRERFFRLPARYRFHGRTHEAMPCSRDEQAIAPPELIQWSELPKSTEKLCSKFIRDVDMLREDIAENPRNGAALYYLGVSLQSLALYVRADGFEDQARRLFNEAIDAFREHRRIDTEGAPAWHEGTAFSCYRAAECYLALGQPDRAIDCALAGMALDAGIAELPWIAAVASLQAGRAEQAIRWAEIAKVHAKGSEAERRRIGFRVPRGLTTGPDEVIAAARERMT